MIVASGLVGVEVFAIWFLAYTIDIATRDTQGILGKPASIAAAAAAAAVDSMNVW
jgi:hypothetical protein